MVEPNPIQSSPKRYLLDTSCIVDDPRIFLALGQGGNQVYLHTEVIYELDKLKDDYKATDPFVRGSARQALNVIREILFSGSDPRQPIPYNGGQGYLHIVRGEQGVRYSHADPALLDYLGKDSKESGPLVLISEDTGLLALASIEGYKAEVRRDVRKGKSLHELLSMQEAITLPHENTEELRRSGHVEVERGSLDGLSQLFHNQYLHLAGEALAVKHTLSGANHYFERVREQERTNGIKPKNKEQLFLMDMAMNPNIQLGAVLGMAGTGKTLLLLAAALKQVQETRDYGKIIIVRPLTTVGEGLGYLPGDMEEKMGPIMQPIEDAIDAINFHSMKVAKGSKSEPFFGLRSFIAEGVIEVVPPTYMRGRNIPNAFIIVDETQNLDVEHVKTLATRIGDGSKVVFNGDPYQIDARYLDQEKNGLVYLTRRLLGQPSFSAVVLKKGERSPASELAAKLL